MGVKPGIPPPKPNLIAGTRHMPWWICFRLVPPLGNLPHIFFSTRKMHVFFANPEPFVLILDRLPAGKHDAPVSASRRRLWRRAALISGLFPEASPPGRRHRAVEAEGRGSVFYYPMPDVFPKDCRSPICPGLAELGQRFCIEHRKIEYRKLDGRQPTSAERKFHNKWKEFAQAFLAKQENDLCAGCREQGKDRKATEAYYKCEIRIRLTAPSGRRIVSLSALTVASAGRCTFDSGSERLFGSNLSRAPSTHPVRHGTGYSVFASK